MKCNKCGAIQQTNNLSTSCQLCGAALGSTSGIKNTIPWEENEERGLVKAFLQTLRVVLLKPSDFFIHINEQINFFPAIMFALLATALGTLGDLIWFNTFPESSVYRTALKESLGANTIAYTPLILILGLLLSSGYIYIITSLFKYRKFSFKTIFSAVCYAQGAAVLTIIPFIGITIMPVWSLVITLIMVARISKITILRSIAILILPIIFLFILILLPLMLFMGGLLFSIGSILKFYQ